MLSYLRYSIENGKFQKTTARMCADVQDVLHKFTYILLSDMPLSMIYLQSLNFVYNKNNNV